MTITSTLHLACPTCGDEIEVEYGVNECDGMAEVVSSDALWARFEGE